MNDNEESVFHLMSTPVVSISPQALVGEVLQLAHNFEIHHFPIVNDDALCGIVCTCDLDVAPREEPVSRFAHRRIVTVAPQSSAREAAAQMLAHQVGSVVIADDEGIWGILTREDLWETVPELMQDIACLACGGRQHLRHRADGMFLCKQCMGQMALGAGEEEA